MVRHKLNIAASRSMGSRVRAFAGSWSMAVFYTVALAGPIQAETLTGVASVIDGDTLEIH